jgi:hypothetical protein
MCYLRKREFQQLFFWVSNDLHTAAIYIQPGAIKRNMRDSDCSLLEGSSEADFAGSECPNPIRHIKVLLGCDW